MAMRKLAFVLIAAAACGKSPSTGDDTMQPDADNNGSAGAAAFEIKSTDILLPAGAEFTKCFYFHTPNTATVAVNKWVSDLTPGSHHMIMFLNPGGSQPADGTIDDMCGIGGSGNLSSIPVWTFATQTPHLEVDLPGDDGAGKPLAQNIPAHSAGYFQMHYLNASDTDEMVHVDLKAYALADGAAYTQTDAYITYNQDISIGPGATGVTVTASCPVPAGVKFWDLSTHSHKQSVDTKVIDGSSMLLDSTDWEHPATKTWTASPYYTFTNPNLTWSCTYDNTGDNAGSTVVAGSSAKTNEMCMATGYFFPATGPKFLIQYGGSCHALN